MPEIPVTLSDDEFLVDAGIRMPAQLAVSQSTSKIPNLQDFIFNRRRSSNVDRSRRSSVNFDKEKPKRHSSLEYNDCPEQRSNGSDQKGARTSTDYEDGLRQRTMKENIDEQQLSKVDSKVKRYSGPHGRTRFGFDVNQTRSTDDKTKRNSLILEKPDKSKISHSKTTVDRTKRHSASYGTKLPDTKDTKQKFKRHSLEVTDYTPSERLGRALRRYSTLDVNHNQGVSKIPLRSSALSGSRTAPATRSSSPVRWSGQLRFDGNHDDSQRSISERHLTRFSSSDEEVDKLCVLLHSQTAPSSRTGSPRGTDSSRLPIRLFRKKL